MAVERAVVTGGAGFVGSSVVRCAVAAFALDRPVPLVEGLRRTIGWIRAR